MTDSNVIQQALARTRARRGLPSPAARRLLREQSGLTQSELARLLDVSRPAVAKYENGTRTPRGDVALRYVEVLGEIARELGATELRRNAAVNSTKRGAERSTA
jgi:transcriptional regulator with XRE-family HTH domain